MRTSLLVLSAAACALASGSLLAQTAATPHRTTTGAGARRTVPAAHPAIPGCATVPTLSPKIPALPAGLGCAKVLYTITSSATQLSPMLSAPLQQSLGNLNQTFTLSYIDTKVGTGPLAAQRMYYTVNYTGYLLDGTKFDSSEGKDPITFPYGAHRVVQGWDTGFEGMHVGGKRRLFIPYQLAYGEAGRPPVIPAKAMLVFDVELVSQSDQAPAPKTPPAPPTPPAGAPGATGATGTPGSTGAAGPTGSTPIAIPQQPAKPVTPPVTSTTPATPPNPTGSTGPRQ